MRLSNILWGAFVAVFAYCLGRLHSRNKGFVLMSEGRFFITSDQGHLHWTEDKTRALKLATREDADQLCTIVEDAERIIEVTL